MKRLKGRFVIITLLIVLWTTGSVMAQGSKVISYDQKEYTYTKFPTIYIDGVKMQQGIMPPIITDKKRTLVPVREFFESLGATVGWRSKEKQAVITYEGKEIVLSINSQQAFIDGQGYIMEETAKLVINKTDNPQVSKTVVPLRFIMENFGFDVEWDGENYAIRLQSQPRLTSLASNPIRWTDKGDMPAVSKPTQQIRSGNYPVTNITEIEEESESKNLRYVIKADSKMSKVSSVIWNRILIIDIEGSIKAFEDELIELENNPYFKQIRSSQYDDDPMTTRIVFDMKYEDLNYDLKLSKDRKNLILEVKQNYIYDIALGQDEESDYVDITGAFLPALDIFWLSNPTRLVMDVPFSDSAFKFEEADANGHYIKGIRTAKFDDTTARVVVDLEQNADFRIETVDEDTVRVRVIKPSYRNIRVDYTTYPTIILSKKGLDLSKEDISLWDNYRQRQGVFTLDVRNAEAVYGKGKIQLNDDELRYIDLYSDNKGYHVSVNTKAVKAYKITEDSQNIYIQVRKPKDIYDKVLVVDPGHGGADPGKPKAKNNYTYLDEKTIDLDMSLRLMKLLHQVEGLKVYMTRVADVYPTLPDRCNLANEVDADFFISIHNNAFVSRFEGTEMLYYDPYKGKTTEFAKIMLENVVAKTKTINRGLRYRDDLFVLKHTKMSAVLVEVAYMTNPRDGAKLRDPDFLQRSAQGIFNGIMKSYGKLK